MEAAANVESAQLDFISDTLAIRGWGEWQSGDQKSLKE